MLDIERRIPMIKVLHLLNYPGRGGSERYILSLAEKLHNNGCIFYLGYSADGPMLEMAKALGIQAFNLPMDSPYDLRAAILLKDFCREFNIDIIHTHFLRENYISAFSKIAGNKAAIINTCHLLEKKKPLLVITNFLINFFTDGIIAVSFAVRDQLVGEGISPKKIEIIHNGVDINYWKGRRNYRIRSELGLTRDDFVITSIARFSEEKSHIFLLESIRELKKTAAFLNVKEFERVKFLFVGDGELMEECKKMTNMFGISDKIIFTGYRSDIRAILHASDLFVSHSRSEALGISILEALASGLPVVATNSGGPSEIINAQNNCGLLVGRNDTEGFAEAMMRFITDKKFYNTCRKNAVAVAEEKFSLDKTAEQTYNLYNKLHNSKCLLSKRRDMS